MMDYSSAEIWLIIILLGIGTFLIRFSFLGAFGRIQLPAFAMRLLRYAPVAILPGLVAPLVIWPDATGGEFDPARFTAGIVALVVGSISKNMLAAIISGAGTLLLLSRFLA